MKDKIGTLFGFVIGVVFVLFGIMWPDNLSNYHSYRHTQLQQKLEHLQSTNAPYEETTKAQEALDDFENHGLHSWQGSLISNRFLLSLEEPMRPYWWHSRSHAPFPHYGISRMPSQKTA